MSQDLNQPEASKDINSNWVTSSRFLFYVSVFAILSLVLGNCTKLFSSGLNPYFCTPKNSSYTSESSSFGRARPCQGRGGRFEPGLSLQNPEFRFGIFFKSLNRRPGGGTGRHAGLRHCSLGEQEFECASRN
jgi:hypothetical protein